MNLYLVLLSLLPWVTIAQDAASLTGLKFSDDLKRMDRNGIGAPNLQVANQIIFQCAQVIL
jgi:hypothetical protein